jgi:hypothetical protein
VEAIGSKPNVNGAIPRQRMGRHAAILKKPKVLGFTPSMAGSTARCVLIRTGGARESGWCTQSSAGHRGNIRGARRFVNVWKRLRFPQRSTASRGEWAVQEKHFHASEPRGALSKLVLDAQRRKK